jgi:hypothetical protein
VAGEGSVLMGWSVGSFGWVVYSGGRDSMSAVVVGVCGAVCVDGGGRGMYGLCDGG